MQAAEAEALLLRLRWALAAHQLWPADAFRLFDGSSNGCLQRKDLAAGLEQLGAGSPNRSRTNRMDKSNLVNYIILQNST